MILIVLTELRPIPADHTLLMHPLFFASFIIMIVTFLNLLPIGQLDGGHVVRSYTSIYTYEYLGFIIIIAMAITGLITLFIAPYASMYYFFLSIILMLFKMIFGRKPHPGPANQFSKIKDYRYLILYLVLVILTLPLPVV